MEDVGILNASTTEVRITMNSASASAIDLAQSPRPSVQAPRGRRPAGSISATAPSSRPVSRTLPSLLTRVDGQVSNTPHVTTPAFREALGEYTDPTHPFLAFLALRHEIDAVA